MKTQTAGRTAAINPALNIPTAADAIASVAAITSNDPIDRLGMLRARIAELTDLAKPLEADIKAQGAGTYSGQLFDANVAEVAGRESPDPAAMEQKLRELGVNDTWFRHHKKIVAPSLRLTVKARR